ncbi:MAG: NAD(P)-dependent oxidoreductase, partial [Alphaproteobacteria bacterium]
MATVAFIGLGVMGAPMAGHLAAKGHAVRVYNRTRRRAEDWAKRHGGAVCASPAEACAGAEIAFLCVGDDRDVRSVVLGEDGMLAGLRAGALIVDHTTASARLARELGGLCVNKRVGFIDAPVSGGQAGAENGALSIMCGGSETDFAKAEPVMRAYAKASRRIGPVGSGQLAKMVNQICIAGIVQGLA